MTASPLLRGQPPKRRSVRVALSLSVGVSWKDSLGRSFNVTGKASNLNLHGAAIRLGQDLPIGGEIAIRNAQGMQKAARVVNLVKKAESHHIYGVEFLPSHLPAVGFWGIQFPQAPQPRTTPAIPG